MIIVNFTSGLGNQLFQFFFGESLKKTNKKNKVVYLDSLLGSDQLKLWDIFNFEIDMIDRKKINKFNFLKKSKFLFITFIKLLIKLNLNRYFDIYSDYDIYQANTSNFKCNFFYGYWQNTDYFKENFSDIKKKLNFKKKLSLYSLDKTLQKYDAIIGVHIRGGDYLKKKNQRIFDNIDKEYYLENIQKIKKKFKNSIFIFFTDDKKYLSRLLPVIDVDHKFIHDLTKDRIDDFQYLSLCDHFIIPNSTFSLWAAFFSNNINKIIIKPENWFKESYSKNYKTEYYFKSF